MLSSTKRGCLNELEQLNDFRSIIQGKEPVLVDFSAMYHYSIAGMNCSSYFFARWCGPCKVLAPILDQAAGKYQEFTFLKVDIDKFPSLANEYQVTSIPFVALFKGGKVVDSFMGAINSTALQKFLDRHK